MLCMCYSAHMGVFCALLRNASVFARLVASKIVGMPMESFLLFYHNNVLN